MSAKPLGAPAFEVLDGQGETGLSGDALLMLRRLLGDRLSASRSVRAHHAQDESHHAPALPDAVAFPADTAEVVEIVKICAAHRVPIVPFGAGSGLEGGVQALAGGLSLDFARMDAVLEIRAEDMFAVVQPGVRRKALNAALRETGLFFPVDPGADASLGGMVATGASGTNAVRYGTMRENVLALTVVLADGSVVRTGTRAPKTSSGYDLTRLFVGSEGTLGIVVEAILRLHPIPETAATAVASFPSLEAAVRTVTDIQQAGIEIGRVEFLDEALIAVIGRRTDLALPVAPTLFFEFQGSPAQAREIAAAVEALAAERDVTGFRWIRAPAEVAALWEARARVPRWAREELIQGGLGQGSAAGAKSWPGDVCVPISRLPAVIGATRADIEASFVPAFLLGHVGDGNFHCVFMLDPEDPDQLAEVERLNRRMVLRALAAGGTATGEHGIGLGKREFLEAEHGAEGVAAMRRVKAAFDPQNLLNPGKVLP